MSGSCDEEQIGISENAKNVPRKFLFNFDVCSEELLDMSHERLKEAIEKKLF